MDRLNPLISLALVPALVLGGAAIRPADRPAVPVEPVKLGFNYMTAAQTQDLWRRADAYALAEAFLKRCGTPSFVERRMRIAADACVEKQALDKVAAYFRNKVSEFTRTRNFICDTPEARKLVRSVRERIDKDVEEVRTMCRNCFIC